MGLQGIGGNGAGGGSPLDKFQKLRDSAQKKMESADRQGELAELIQRKQKQLGGGASSPDAARSPAERIPQGPGRNTAASVFGAAADAAAKAGAPAAPSAAYGRSGTASRQDAAPRLGQYVDFRA